LTLVPYIPSAGEIKTKPTQHSVKELREIGIQPDVLLCRADRVVPDHERAKIALFTNVNVDAVISAVDVDSIYKIPSVLHVQKLDDIILKRLNLQVAPADLGPWDRIVSSLENPKDSVTIALVGKYVDLTESYKSLSEALVHAGIHCSAKINIIYIDSESIEKDGVEKLQNVDAILVPGGFGQRGVQGKIEAIRFARENSVPYLGICLGMQLAVIEFARNVLGLADAHSTEFDSKTKNPVIGLITEWQDASGEKETRSAESDLGGTMRLGAQRADLLDGTKIRKIYGSEFISERHRHRYEVNNNYVDQLVSGGLTISGKSPVENLCEVVEIRDHPWFIACQFHPEFTSTPRAGHPLFSGFIEAARDRSKKVEINR